MLQEKKLNTRWLIVCLCIMAAGIVYLMTGLARESLWYDESFSAMIIRHTFGDIWNIAATDSHPPLYFFSLRLFSLIFGNSVFSLRFFSLLGTAAMASLGLGPVRKIFGRQTALIYILLAFFVPISLAMSQEVRMYTWAAFFVTGSALYAFLSVSEKSRKNRLLFTLFSISAAYTHYYALLAVIIINGLMLFYLILRDRKKLKPYFICAGIMIISYLPWVLALLEQVKKVANSYWIEPLNFRTITDVLLYPFGDKFRVFWVPKSWSAFSDIPAFIIAFGIIIFGLQKALIRKRNEDRMALLAFLVYALTIIGGIAASEFIRPVLIGRYMMPVLGVFLIALSSSIWKLPKPYLKYTSLILLLLLFIPQILFVSLNRFNGPMDLAASYLRDNTKPGTVFLHTDEHTFGVFCFYLPEAKHFLYLGPGYPGYSGYKAFQPMGSAFSNKMNGFMNAGTNFILVYRPYAPQSQLTESWLASGKLKIIGPVKDFRYRYSFMGITLFPAARTLKEVAEAEWGIPDMTNTLDRHNLSEKSGMIKIILKGFEDNSGTARVVLYEQGIILPGNLFQYKYAVISNNTAEVIFKDVPYGEYAVFAFHDRNLNERPDSLFGFYTEESGISGSGTNASDKFDYDRAGFPLSSNEADINILMRAWARTE